MDRWLIYFLDNYEEQWDSGTTLLMFAKNENKLQKNKGSHRVFAWSARHPSTTRHEYISWNVLQTTSTLTGFGDCSTQSLQGWKNGNVFYIMRGNITVIGPMGDSEVTRNKREVSLALCHRGLKLSGCSIKTLEIPATFRHCICHTVYFSILPTHRTG